MKKYLLLIYLFFGYLCLFTNCAQDDELYTKDEKVFEARTAIFTLKHPIVLDMVTSQDFSSLKQFQQFVKLDLKSSFVVDNEKNAMRSISGRSNTSLERYDIVGCTTSSLDYSCAVAMVPIGDGKYQSGQYVADVYKITLDVPKGSSFDFFTAEASPNCGYSGSPTVGGGFWNVKVGYVQTDLTNKVILTSYLVYIRTLKKWYPCHPNDVKWSYWMYATTFCINCSITGEGSVMGTGCGFSNGLYSLVAKPAHGWRSSWEGNICSVNVNDQDVYESVVFTKGEGDNKVYYLSSKDGYSIGLFLNGRRVAGNNTYEIVMDDVITVEKPGKPQTKWFVNGQYVATGDIVTFTVRNYVYSANNEEFVISFE